MKCLIAVFRSTLCHLLFRANISAALVINSMFVEEYGPVHDSTLARKPFNITLCHQDETISDRCRSGVLGRLKLRHADQRGSVASGVFLPQ